MESDDCCALFIRREGLRRKSRPFDFLTPLLEWEDCYDSYLKVLFACLFVQVFFFTGVRKHLLEFFNSTRKRLLEGHYIQMSLWY